MYIPQSADIFPSAFLGHKNGNTVVNHYMLSYLAQQASLFNSFVHLTCPICNCVNFKVG